MMRNITVIGAGATGIAFSATLVEQGHNVTLFELEKAAAHLKELKKRGKIVRTGYGPQGDVALPRMTTAAAEAVPNAELIFIAAVANRHELICKTIAPYLHDGQTVCFFNGNCGSIRLKRLTAGKDIVVGETVGTYTSTRYLGDGVVHFASMPKSPKSVAAFPARDSSRLVERIGECYPTVCYPDVPVHNVFEGSLNSPNVSIHLAASLLCVSAMERSLDFRLYRDGVCPSTLTMIRAVEAEKEAVFSKFGYKSNSYFGQIEACLNFDADPRPNLAGFRLTTGPNGVSHRYISEDAFAGDCLLVSLGEALGVDTPVLRSAVTMAGVLNGINYLKEGLTLKSLGLEGRSADEIHSFLETGEL